jgi:hypothetical protein
MRKQSNAARTILLAAGLVIGASSVAPSAHAGVLWAGLGSPIAYTYAGVGFYGASTLVYNPFYYYFTGYPYYGYARDFTYFYGYSPFYTAPWVWGFWDPPDQGNINTPIEYDEVFTGLDNSGNAIGLNGLQVDSSVVNGLSGANFQGDVFHTTFGQIESLANPTNFSNIELLLGQAITNNPNGAVDLVRYTNVPIAEIAAQAPEPAGFLYLIGAGLLLAGKRWKRRSAAPE